MKILKTLSVLTCLMLFAQAFAFALTVRPVDLKDLTAKADLIFIGTVTTIKTERAPDTIYTYVTFSDLTVVKGTHAQDAIEVRLSGGTVTAETLHIPGMPKFVIGERNLIFLAGNFRYICPIVGWGQGRFKIRWDEALGQDVLYDDTGIRLKEISGDKVIRVKTAVSPSDASPGVPDTGDPVSRIQEPEGQELQTGVSLESFIAAIETRMGIRP